MKKILLFALGALMSVNASAYENVAANFSWAVGDEKEAVIDSKAADGVKETKVAVGVGLTTGSKSDYAVNNGNKMITYQPATPNAGADASVMIEYTVKMKKGITFQLTEISYDALKDGTDNASYSWSYAVDGEEAAVTDVPKEELLRNSGNNAATANLNHVHSVAATPGQVVSFRIYVSGFANNKKFALSNVQLAGWINGEEQARAFTDFKIDFRSEEPTVTVANCALPEGCSLPENVTLSNLNYHGTQHGIQGGTITVVVDGPVKFTLGGCQYGKTINVKKNGEDLISIDNKVGCDNSGVGNGYSKFVTWTYNVEEEAELSFTVNGYLPYFFAEACDFVPQVEVRYYDTDGKTLIGSEIVDGGSKLAYKYSAADVTVAEGKAFRGWFNGSVPTATKVQEGIGLTENLTLYARATDIEVAAVGKIFDYDFRPNYFYPEDHELIAVSGNNSHNGTQHGWAFENGSKLSIQVAGNALLAVDVCTYSKTGKVALTDAEGNVVGELNVEREVTADGSKQTIYYEGPATTLTFAFTQSHYIHHLRVYNIVSLPEKSEYGYYILSSGDAAGLKLVLESVEAGDKIFLTNGVYDFGEEVLTQIAKSNISIIGQSMEGTIIKNAPDFHNEGIGTTATLFIPKSVSNTYFQDLTIENDMDYFAAQAAGLPGGRGVCLQDEGTHTVLKNVRLFSNQDTYYGKTAGAQHYFEDCEVYGTVDFICGAGSVYFKNNLLSCRQRNASGTGSDCVTAHNGKDANGDKGYVFEGCTLKSVCPVVSFGRAWGDQARTVFLNTLVDYSEGTFAFEDSKGEIQRWTVSGINTNPTFFGEYNTHLVDGTVLTPASNVVTFKKNAEVTMETVLSAEEAALFTMESTLGEWAETAANNAMQVEAEKTAEELEADAIYMAETEGQFVTLLKGSEFFDKLSLYDGKVYTLRKANGRGGFGVSNAAEQGQGIDNTCDCQTEVKKIIRDGQVIIVRDDKEFNVLGTQL